MILRRLFSLFLTLALAFTSISVAQARGAAAATDQMVICSGTGTMVVYVDADGQPTHAPHLCAECVLMLAPTDADAPLLLTRTLPHTKPTPPPAFAAAPPLTAPRPPTRAPPLSA